MDCISTKVLPYFVKNQDDRSGLAAKNPKYHGSGGTWSTDQVRSAGDEITESGRLRPSEAGS